MIIHLNPMARAIRTLWPRPRQRTPLEMAGIEARRQLHEGLLDAARRREEAARAAGG